MVKLSEIICVTNESDWGGGLGNMKQKLQTTKSSLYSLHQITTEQIINYPWKVFTSYMSKCVPCNHSMTHSSGN